MSCSNVAFFPYELQPQERFYEVGVENLNDAELLALLLRTGCKKEHVLTFSQRILQTLGGLQGLKDASKEELCCIKGLGEVRSIQLKAMLELGYRLADCKRIKLGKVYSSRQFGLHLVQIMKDFQQEKLVAIYLNTIHQVIKQDTVFVGSLNLSIAHPREILKGALKCSAAYFIIAHNHPSGVRL